MNMNIKKLLKQAQKMQSEVMKQQEGLKTKHYEASAGGGVVRVKVNGDFELLEVKIDPQAVDPDDVELLQDMIRAAVNEAVRAAQEDAKQLMAGLTSGMGMNMPF